MVAAVAERGYPAVRIKDLAALAGISKRDFYESFASKEECFLATFGEIVERSATVIGDAYRAGSGFRGKLLAALRAYARLVVEQPAAASLVIVDSLSLGTAALALHEEAEAHFVQLLRQSLAQAPQRGEISALAIRGVIGGGRQVLYSYLREGRPERFAEHAEELLDWVLDYRGMRCGHVLDESFFAARRPPLDAEAEGNEGEAAPVWEEPPSSERSRAVLSGRERIMRAVAQLAGAGGYASLSMPAITAAAAVSNRTFYREFADKQEAFLAAFDALGERLLEVAAPAFGEDGSWPEAIGAVLHALLTVIARSPLFARLAFFELAAAGPAGRDHARRVTQRFTAFLSAEMLPEGIEPLPEILVQAIGGGIWTVIQQEVGRGRIESLPELAPELTDFALAPFGSG